MNEYWFKPHRYGIGASPSTWEGWAALLAYVFAMVWIGDWFVRHHRIQTPGYFITVGLLSAAMIVIAWWRTKGGWRWRWGDPD